MMLIFCMLATGIILPIGLVVGSTAHGYRADVPPGKVMFVFEEVR